MKFLVRWLSLSCFLCVVASENSVQATFNARNLQEQQGPSRPRARAAVPDNLKHIVESITKIRDLFNDVHEVLPFIQGQDFTEKERGDLHSASAEIATRAQEVLDSINETGRIDEESLSWFRFYQPYVDPDVYNNVYESIDLLRNQHNAQNSLETADENVDEIAADSNTSSTPISNEAESIPTETARPSDAKPRQTQEPDSARYGQPAAFVPQSFFSDSEDALPPSVPSSGILSDSGINKDNIQPITNIQGETLEDVAKELESIETLQTVSKAAESALELNEDSEKSNEQNIPINKEEIAPLKDEQIFNMENIERNASGQNNQTASSNDGQSPPSDNIQSSPSNDDQSSPSNGGQSSPSNDDQSSPSNDDQSSPSNDDQSSPSNDDQSSPSNDDQSSPSNDDQSSPSNDDQSSSSNDDQSSPSNDDQSSPSNDDRNAALNGDLNAAFNGDLNAPFNDKQSPQQNNDQSTLQNMNQSFSEDEQKTKELKADENFMVHLIKPTSSAPKDNPVLPEENTESQSYFIGSPAYNDLGVSVFDLHKAVDDSFIDSFNEDEIKDEPQPLVNSYFSLDSNDVPKESNLEEAKDLDSIKENDEDDYLTSLMNINLDENMPEANFSIYKSEDDDSDEEADEDDDDSIYHITESTRIITPDHDRKIQQINGEQDTSEDSDSDFEEKDNDIKNLSINNLSDKQNGEAESTKINDYYEDDAVDSSKETTLRDGPIESTGTGLSAPESSTPSPAPQNSEASFANPFTNIPLSLLAAIFSIYTMF